MFPLDELIKGDVSMVKKVAKKQNEKEINLKLLVSVIINGILGLTVIALLLTGYEKWYTYMLLGLVAIANTFNDGIEISRKKDLSKQIKKLN